MPTTLKTRYDPTWDGYPPHMSAEDYEIWRRWKLSGLIDAVALYFDVGLGGQTTVPAGTSPEMALMWLTNTQKRIDVLVETLRAWHIVELRANASSSGLGRLFLYRKLWYNDPPDQRPTKLFLISNTHDPDIKATADDMGINYITV